MSMAQIYHTVAWQDDEHRRKHLKDLASRYAALPEVRRYTLRVLRAAAVKNTDPIGTIYAVYNYVKTMIPYRHEYGEQIELPLTLLRSPGLGADCDGHALLVATMLASVGIPTRLAFWSAGGTGRDLHVSAQARDMIEWVNLDTTQRQPLGWTPVGYTQTNTGLI